MFRAMFSNVRGKTMTKVSELIGAELDKWVARAHGMIVTAHPVKKGATLTDFWGYEKAEGVHAGPRVAVAIFKPSVNWLYGGPIIERGVIAFWPDSHDDSKDPTPGYWLAQTWKQAQDDVSYVGDTPLVAAMRAFVASVYGDEVSE